MELGDVLRHEGPPRTEYFLEVPTEFGKLRLDLPGDVATALAQAGVSPEAERKVSDVLGEAARLGESGDTAGQQRMLLDAVKQYPYASALYGALADSYDRQGNLPEAEYYLKQVVALQPDYRNLTYLARNLGRQGRLDGANAVQDYLWQTHSQADKSAALEAAHDYLVTLGRLQQPKKMMEVCMQAMQEFGGETTLVYQYIFALVLDNQSDAARSQLQRVLPQLDPADPLYPRFMQMRDYLGLPSSERLR